MQPVSLSPAVFDPLPNDGDVLLESSELEAYRSELLMNRFHVIISGEETADVIMPFFHNRFESQESPFNFTDSLAGIRGLGTLAYAPFVNPDPAIYWHHMIVDWILDATYGQLKGYAQFLEKVFNSTHEGGFLETHQGLKIASFIINPSEQLTENRGLLRFSISFKTSRKWGDCYQLVLSFLRKIANDPHLHSRYLRYQKYERAWFFPMQGSVSPSVINRIEALSENILELIEFLEFPDWAPIVQDSFHIIRNGNPKFHTIPRQMIETPKNIRVAITYARKDDINSVVYPTETSHLPTINQKLTTKAILPPLSRRGKLLSKK